LPMKQRRGGIPVPTRPIKGKGRLLVIEVC
jgi:hypothetical protein